MLVMAALDPGIKSEDMGSHPETVSVQWRIFIPRCFDR